MNDKKNIDRLFQERFKDFEVVPDDKIWNNIHDALHEKKKKKVIPLWWKLTGIAAGLVLAFLLFNTFSDGSGEIPTVVVAPEKVNEVQNQTLEQNNKTEVVLENKTSSDKEKDLNDKEQNSIKPTSENSVALEEISVSEKDKPNSSNKNSNQDFNTRNSNLKNASSKKDNLKKSSENALVENGSKNSSQKSVQKTILSNEKSAESDSNSNNKKTVIAENKSTNTSKSDENESTMKQSSLNNSDVSTEGKKELAADTAKKKSDSLALALTTEPNPLEEILRKKNEKETVLADAKLNRWQVSTNVAPVYFNSASNGSPIESQFAENSKSYENNLSVGVGVQYAVNKKLSVRTGVNKMTLAYGTNDVMFFGALNSFGVENLGSNPSTDNIEVISMNNFAALKPFEDNLQNMESGVLNQRMGYYEVPLELSYSVINKKFGVQVIGGVSTLFLEENVVSVQSATTNISLGQASNLNDVHFSSNIGLGFKYEFLKSFEAHFEPTIKYQFNTFSRDAGNFRPYFVGLYTGVSFRF